MAAWLRIGEAAASLGCSESQVRLDIAAGDLVAVRVGRRSVRIDSDSVLDLQAYGRGWARDAGAALAPAPDRGDDAGENCAAAA